MKKVIFFSVVAIMLVLLSILSCNKLTKDPASDQSDKESRSIVVGNVLKSGLSDLGLTFEEAVALIVQYNTLVNTSYNYDYTEVWIEELTNLDSSIDYYLASRADVTDEFGNPVGSCYSHYFNLVEENGTLRFSAPGNQYSCKGYCCSSCALKPTDNGHTDPWCSCSTPSTTPGCVNEARCDQSTTITIGSTQ